MRLPEQTVREKLSAPEGAFSHMCRPAFRNGGRAGGGFQKILVTSAGTPSAPTQVLVRWSLPTP